MARPARRALPWLAGVVLALAALPPSASPAPPLFTRVFIQSPGFVKPVADSTAPYATKCACFARLWDEELDALVALGIDTVVWQHVGFDGRRDFTTRGADCLAIVTSEGEYHPLHLERLLAGARSRHLRVWIGLQHRQAWNDAGWSRFVAEHAAAFRADTRQILTELRESGLVAAYADVIEGWYLPVEIDNGQLPGDPAAGQALLADAVAQARDLLSRPVAVSAFCRPPAPAPSETAFATALTATLRGSGIAEVLFQDSVGVELFTEETFDAEAQHALAARYATIKRAVADASTPAHPVALRAVLELQVGGVCGTARTASVARIKAQALAAAGIPRAAFEYGCYLSPLVDGAGGRTLYRDLCGLQAGAPPSLPSLASCP